MSSEYSPEQIKQALLLECLANEPVVSVMINPAIEGVILPEHLMKMVTVKLDIGLHLPKPIFDLKVEEGGWSGTFSFGGLPFHCLIPWEAVWCIGPILDGKEVIFKESVPEPMQDAFPELKPTRVEFLGVLPTYSEGAEFCTPIIDSVSVPEPYKVKVQPKPKSKKRRGPPKLSLVKGGLYDSTEERPKPSRDHLKLLQGGKSTSPEDPQDSTFGPSIA